MKLLISDTADATITRKSDGQVFATAETQLSALSTTLGINEKIYGSIGQKTLGMIRGQKEISTNFRNAFYDANFIAMTQGVSITADGTANVYKREEGLTVTDNAGVLEVTIIGSPIETTVHVVNEYGEVESAAVATNTVTVPTGHALEGNLVAVTYQEAVTGDIVTLDSTKFSEAYQIEYRTIAYNPVSNVVAKDIYIQLDHVIPSGDFELSFENGSAIAPEITFDAMNSPNSDEMGRIIEVDRV